MNATELEQAYTLRHNNFLEPASLLLEIHLRETITGLTMPRIDKIAARAKSIQRFIEKSQKTEIDGKLKYTDPLNQIQDQLGARIVTFYISDIPIVTKTIEDYYRPIERQSIVPDSPNEFGYEGVHYILFLPDEISKNTELKSGLPNFFELQIKTLFQHAWGEANHDLGYKPTCPLSFDEKRKIAFSAAQAWGADHIFNELHSAQKG
jgi:ppGpp synthetase/RelA/SpoT-type nucleotidyltranferase